MSTPPDTLSLALAVNAAATLLMTGLAWFVHVVHYPMFRTAAEAGGDHWTRFERVHLDRTTLVIPPIMLAELAAAIAFLVLAGPGQQRTTAIIGAALLAVVWIVTFLGAVPMHHRLRTRFDTAVHKKLMLCNLIRTLAWSARSFLAIMLLTPGA